MLDSIATLKKNAWIGPAIAFLVALLLFSINLDRPPHPDELHHVLAAQHLLETGRPLIGEGEYWRGILHTWMVVISYEVFGEGLASARIPPVLLVALVAPILFLWVRREAGSLAAWLTAVLFISSPFTVEIAQFSRFYALQMLSFVLGALCAYYALAAAVSLPRRVLLGALASGLLILAISVQITTFVGMLGIAVWTGGLLTHRALLYPATSSSARRIAATVVVALGIVVIIAATTTGVLEMTLELFRRTPLHAAERTNQFWFYHLRLLLFYPTLWTLFGVLAILAILNSPRLAWLAIAIFSISFLVMSFAGWKATRYLSFSIPFLSIVWGIGLAQFVQLLRRHAIAMRMRLAEKLALPERLGSAVATAGMVVALAIVILANPFWLRTTTVIGNVALPGETPVTDWRLARDALASWIADADIMITTEELGAIYFLGRSDVRYSPSKLRELPPDQSKEFGIDFRTGRPIIAKPESVEQLIECFPRGFVVGPIEHWGNPILISEAVQAVLSRYAKPIEVPEESYLYAWGWDRAPRETKPSYCSDLSRFSGKAMR